MGDQTPRLSRKEYLEMVGGGLPKSELTEPLVKDKRNAANTDDRHRNKQQKYGAERVFYDNIWFDSKGECERYKVLRLEEAAGNLRNLTLQPELAFWENNRLIFTYRADFKYYANNATWLEDFKGMKTPLYRLKKKLIEARYIGRRIIEITDPNAPIGRVGPGAGTSGPGLATPPDQQEGDAA